MELVAAAVSADLAHDTVSVIQGMSVNSLAHIAEESPRYNVLNTDFHTLFRDIDQLLPLGLYITDAIHA